jgi:hypothetical protein
MSSMTDVSGTFAACARIEPISHAREPAFGQAPREYRGLKVPANDEKNDPQRQEHPSRY